MPASQCLLDWDRPHHQHHNFFQETRRIRRSSLCKVVKTDEIMPRMFWDRTLDRRNQAGCCRRVGAVLLSFLVWVLGIIRICGPLLCARAADTHIRDFDRRAWRNTRLRNYRLVPWPIVLASFGSFTRHGLRSNARAKKGQISLKTVGGKFTPQCENRLDQRDIDDGYNVPKHLRYRRASIEGMRNAEISCPEIVPIRPSARCVDAGDGRRG